MKYLIIAAAAIVSACAQSPASIAPASLGDAYAGLPCRQAANMRATEAKTLAALSAKQTGAMVGDAIGVLLIAVPLSSLTGGNVAGDIAASKGKINALDARLAACQ